jgi:hypothetical protein
MSQGLAMLQRNTETLIDVLAAREETKTTPD